MRPVLSQINKINKTGLNTKAFTLIELIVVITILAILGTIAFISLQGYSKDARNSVRITDLSNIDKQLDLYLLKGSKLPLPDEALTLTSSGIIIGYQGYIGEESLNKTGINGGAKDPLDDTYYTYRINANKTAYQIMGYLEDGRRELSLNILLQTNAADLTKRYPLLKGNTLGILVDTTTNKPLNQLETGTLELRTYTTNQVDMYLSTTSKNTGIGTGTTLLYGTLENLNNSQNFTLPLECPTGFIEIPGNRDLGQPSFCVAKYEMSFSGLVQTDNSGNWNTYSYLDNGDQGKVVSQQGNSPIAEITQTEAISECEAMGTGYHLITNKEWMTIARNIEQQPTNWSGGVVGKNFIYNGISNDLIMGCDGDSVNNMPTGSIFATITGHNICDGKNKLILSNGEEIWDLSGNVWEYVNGADTFDGTNYSNMQAQACGRTDSVWGWNSFFGNDGVTECDFSNGYSYSNIGPFISDLNANNGIGRVYNYGGSLTDRIFFRGGSSITGFSTGIYSLDLIRTSSNKNLTVGFRCAFNLN